jgi:hypothetical protein
MDAEGNPTLDTPETVRGISSSCSPYGINIALIPRQSDYNVAETLFKDQRAGEHHQRSVGVGRLRRRPGSTTAIAPLPISVGDRTLLRASRRSDEDTR